MLGQVDLDSFVDSHVTTAQEFEENYKAVRARRREAEKLPEVVKVESDPSCQFYDAEIGNCLRRDSPHAGF